MLCWDYTSIPGLHQGTKARPIRSFLPTLLPVSSWVTMERTELASAKGRVVCFWAEGECFRLVPLKLVQCLKYMKRELVRT